MDFVCEGCEKKRTNETTWCEVCRDEHCNEAAEDAVTKYLADNSPATTVRAWAERRRLLHGMDSTVAAFFEDCAQDMEAGFRG